MRKLLQYLTLKGELTLTSSYLGGKLMKYLTLNGKLTLTKYYFRDLK